MSNLHLGFTGTSELLPNLQQLSLMRILRAYRDRGFDWMHNGDCVGADHRAACLWRLMGGKVFGHPPDRQVKRAWFDFDHQTDPKPYGVRNHDIVACSQILIACPKEVQEVLRSGTWMTIRMARKANIPINIILPYGQVGIEGPG